MCLRGHLGGTADAAHVSHCEARHEGSLTLLVSEVLADRYTRLVPGVSPLRVRSRTGNGVNRTRHFEEQEGLGVVASLEWLYLDIHPSARY